MTATTAIPDDVPGKGGNGIRFSKHPFPRSQPASRKEQEMPPTNGLGDQPGEDVFLIVLRHGGDDGREGRHAAHLVFLRIFRAQPVQVDVSRRLRAVLGRLVVVDERLCNVGAASQEPLVFWRQVSLSLSCCAGDCGRRHFVDAAGLQLVQLADEENWQTCPKPKRD